MLPDSPGLRPGDVVLRVERSAPADFGDLAESINATRPGPSLTVRREGSLVELHPAAREEARDHRFRIGGSGRAPRRRASASRCRR
ncbi:MAG: hypothetical protein R3A52_08035 [Polyangiales bacterium]